MKISIIIVSYNSSKYLPSCLDSILLSKPRDVISEIIVVDNASTDGSREIVSRYSSNEPKVRLVSLRSNVGFPKACNIGASMAKSDIIVFMNPDVTIDPDCFWILLSYLTKHTDVAVVQPKILKVDGKHIESTGGVMDLLAHGYHLGEGELDAGNGEEPKEIFYACFACAMVRKDVFLELGGLDPIFFLSQEDVDFCWRAWLAGYRVVYIPQARVYHVGQHSLKQRPYLALFHARKNRLITLFTNYPLLLSLITLPTLSLLYIGAAVFALIRKRNRDAYAFIASLLWFLKHIKYIVKRRSKISRRRSTVELFKCNFIKLRPVGLRLHLSRLHLTKLGLESD